MSNWAEHIAVCTDRTECDLSVQDNQRTNNS